MDAIHDEFGTPRPMIRIDSFIIAIAIEVGAEKIVTNNVEEFQKLARGRIAITPVPELESRSTPLFPKYDTDEG